MHSITSTELLLIKLVCIIIFVLFHANEYNYAGIPPEISPVPKKVPQTEIIVTRNDNPLGDFQSLTIPLKRAGHLFLIEAKIDDQIGNLIFDTGASGLVLNSTYFRKYVSIEKSAGGGVTGALDKVYQTTVRRIDISNLYYTDVSADLADLGHIENRRGVKVLGLFGLNMIDNFEVLFNAGSNELQLNRIDKHGNRLEPVQEMKYEFTQKMETQHKFMLIRGKIGEKTLNFCLDTGAESNIISNELPKKVMNTIQINRRSSLGGTGAGTVDVFYGIMKDLEFGNHQFGSMETIVTSLSAMSEAYGCSIDGMLGYDFWQKFIFCFNFGKNEISFSKAKGDNK